MAQAIRELIDANSRAIAIGMRAHKHDRDKPVRIVVRGNDGKRYALTGNRYHAAKKKPTAAS